MNASFHYDGDGQRVKSTINGVATTFVGNYYEVTSGTITKYYYAGAQRVAIRVNGTLSFLFTDHLGSTSVTTDANGNRVSEMRYTAWGEVRFTEGLIPTRYSFTGQYSNMTDFGLMFYNARWYDPALGRFAQADSLVPPGVQGYDRYAYVNNDPARYTDPTGHCSKLDDDYDLCLEQLEYVEQAYSVEVKGTARWTMTSLTSIQKGMERLRTSIEYTAFSNLFTGVTFQIGGGGVAHNGMGTTGHKDIILGKDVSDAIYIEHETVHELAHIWDNACDDCMSKGMMEATKGSQYRKYWLFGDIIYKPGGNPPTDYAKKSRREDWAESVTAYLYLSYGALDQSRLGYVTNAFANPIP